MRARLRIAAFRDRAEVTLLLNEFGDEASPAGLMRGAKAGAGGTVIVKSGVHTESGTVVISAPVSIIGETGAVIESGTSPSTTYPLAIVAVLDIKNTHDVKVRGISLGPQGGGTSNCTMLIESSPVVQILNNNVTEFQFGVWVEHGG